MSTSTVHTVYKYESVSKELLYMQKSPAKKRQIIKAAKSFIMVHMLLK